MAPSTAFLATPSWMETLFRVITLGTWVWWPVGLRGTIKLLAGLLLALATAIFRRPPRPWTFRARAIVSMAHNMMVHLTVPERRIFQDKMSRALANKVRVVPEAAPVRGVWIGRRPGPDTDWSSPNVRCIFYLHGGAYAFGNAGMYADVHTQCVRALQRRGTEAFLFSLEYRLAPEHPFPCALEDAVAGYAWLVRDLGVPESKLCVAGDSAGGHLAVSLLYELGAAQSGAAGREPAVRTAAGAGVAASAGPGGRALRPPATAALISPWVDLSQWRPSHTAGAGCDILPVSHLTSDNAGLALYSRYFRGALPADSPYASPVFADYTGLTTRVFVLWGQGELLDDECAALVARLREQGVPVRSHAEPGMPHVYPYLAIGFPDESRAAVELLADAV